MKLEEQLASRLRQSIQGCTSHIHGPVQAWQAVNQAVLTDNVSSRRIAMTAILACSSRINELVEAGVKPDDVRIIKEELSRDFIKKLFL